MTESAELNRDKSIKCIDEPLVLFFPLARSRRQKIIPSSQTGHTQTRVSNCAIHRRAENNRADGTRIAGTGGSRHGEIRDRSSTRRFSMVNYPCPTLA